MLFDPHVLVREPWAVLAVVAIIILGKTVAAITLVLALRHQLNTALTVGASLAQIGEFPSSSPASASLCLLVIATPHTVHVRRMVEVARKLNPQIEIVLRTHSDEEAELLRRENCGLVFMGEHELALAMTRHVVERMSDGARA